MKMHSVVHLKIASVKILLNNFQLALYCVSGNFVENRGIKIYESCFHLAVY